MSAATASNRNASGRFAPRGAHPTPRQELYALWAVAAAEANLAYDAWAASGGSRSYSVFLAASDRASAAQDALAAAS